MDEKPTIEDFKNALGAPESTSTQPVEPETSTEESDPTEDPLKIELERVKGKKTPAEKAKDSLFFNAQKAKELGLDPAEILGLKPKEEVVVNEDEKPVTQKQLIEALNAIKTVNSVKTAEELASSITNEAERELTLYHIQNTIRSTGNPEEDLKLARALTNSVRNNKILEEQARKPDAKTFSSSSSGGVINAEPQIVLTAEEQAYLNTGHVTKEEILLARQGKPLS